uniref:Uncharacterized protein n=1 Tax=Arundo donax TaxID=35708 RepID=A0A0A9DFW3_ARUDO
MRKYLPILNPGGKRMGNAKRASSSPEPGARCSR